MGKRLENGYRMVFLLGFLGELIRDLGKMLGFWGIDA